MKYLATCILLLACVMPLNGQSIYLYDRDLGDIFQDPESGRWVGCEVAVQTALAQNGYACTVGTGLPSNLSQEYDLLFIVMGNYC